MILIYHVLIYGSKITAASCGFPATARLSCFVNVYNVKILVSPHFFVENLSPCIVIVASLAY